MGKKSTVLGKRSNSSTMVLRNSSTSVVRNSTDVMVRNNQQTPRDSTTAAAIYFNKSPLASCQRLEDELNQKLGQIESFTTAVMSGENLINSADPFNADYTKSLIKEFMKLPTTEDTLYRNMGKYVLYFAARFQSHILAILNKNDQMNTLTPSLRYRASQLERETYAYWISGIFYDLLIKYQSTTSINKATNAMATSKDQLKKLYKELAQRLIEDDPEKSFLPHDIALQLRLQSAGMVLTAARDTLDEYWTSGTTRNRSRLVLQKAYYVMENGTFNHSKFIQIAIEVFVSTCFNYDNTSTKLPAVVSILHRSLTTKEKKPPQKINNENCQVHAENVPVVRYSFFKYLKANCFNKVNDCFRFGSHEEQEEQYDEEEEEEQYDEEEVEEQYDEEEKEQHDEEVEEQYDEERSCLWDDDAAVDNYDAAADDNDASRAHATDNINDVANQLLLLFSQPQVDLHVSQQCSAAIKHVCSSDHDPAKVTNLWNSLMTLDIGNSFVANSVVEDNDNTKEIEVVYDQVVEKLTKQKPTTSTSPIAAFSKLLSKLKQEQMLEEFTAFVQHILTNNPTITSNFSQFSQL